MVTSVKILNLWEVQIGEIGEYICLDGEGVVNVDIIQEASYVIVSGYVGADGIIQWDMTM